MPALISACQDALARIARSAGAASLNELHWVVGLHAHQALAEEFGALRGPRPVERDLLRHIVLRSMLGLPVRLGGYGWGRQISLCATSSDGRDVALFTIATA